MTCITTERTDSPEIASRAVKLARRPMRINK
jgi:hypothetical protein